MIELLVGGVVAFAVLMVLGVVGAVLSLVFGLVVLPFKLLGLAFRGIGVLLALPFMLLFGIVGAVLLAGGLLLFFTPLLPFALIILGLVWLMRRRAHPARA